MLNINTDAKIMDMLERLGFNGATARYLVKEEGLDSLKRSEY